MINFCASREEGESGEEKGCERKEARRQERGKSRKEPYERTREESKEPIQRRTGNGVGRRD